MSLATRCASCGTVFRVVQDQLKVSEGWVRCGRCNEVFNALEGLLDLGRDTLPDVLAPTDGGEMAAIGIDAGAEPAQNNVSLDAGPDPHLVDKLDSRLFGTRPASSESGPASQLRDRHQSEFSDARFNSEWGADDPDEVQAGAPFSADPAKESRVDRPAPEFVRRAQREERWRGPGARLALSSMCMVFLTGLVLQTTHHFRDQVAARLPTLRPMLAAWCDLASCRLEAPRRIEDISVESTALARVGTSDAFRLSVALRNRGQTVLALPSVELSLTDGSGLTIARKALGPRDFQVASNVLPAGGETSLQLLVSASTLRVSGYTVEIFYP